MKVLDGKILVQVDKETYVEKIGEFKVQVGAGQYEVAKVIAVGPKVEGDVKVDDTVYIYNGAGKVFTKEGIEYRVVTSNEVIVVL